MVPKQAQSLIEPDKLKTLQAYQNYAFRQIGLIQTWNVADTFFRVVCKVGQLPQYTEAHAMRLEIHWKDPRTDQQLERPN